MPPPAPNPKPPSSGDAGEAKAKDAALGATAGFVAFSGIVMSIIKALTPKPHNPPPPKTPLPLQEISKKPAVEEGAGSSLGRTVEIVRGDTLWGLSRKYGVSIDAIREANGIKGDTIYAGKKLVIP